MSAFCDPHFLVDGQNRIHSFVYTDRIFEFVHIWENKDTYLSIYGKIRMRKSQHFGAVLRRGFLTRLKIARYKGVPAIKKVLYREMLPCDEFIIQKFSINRTCVRYFDRNSTLFNLFIEVINGVNLISKYNKS